MDLPPVAEARTPATILSASIVLLSNYYLYLDYSIYSMPKHGKDSVHRLLPDP